jgi:cyanuric acid amidohydrolase
MHRSEIHVYPTEYPGDVSGLRELLDSGTVDPSDIEGVMITHEGDLYGNALAFYEVAGVLAEASRTSRDEVVDTLPIQAMAGASGFMVPHTAVFTRTEVDGSGPGGKRFTVAGACTRRLEPHEIGTVDYVQEVSNTVQDLMKKADVESSDDVHLVFVKTPWPNPQSYRRTRRQDDRSLLSEDWWEAGAFGRGGAALGVALALGEIDESDVTQERILRDETLYSTVAQCSSTEDRRSAAVIVFANTSESASDLVIGHGVLEDGLDTDGVKSILRGMGFTFECCPSRESLEAIRYSWIKPKTSEAPLLRGFRHTLMTQPFLGSFWWSVEKGPIHAMVASVIGNTVSEVATGAEHQGPNGKPLVAILAGAP